MEFVKRTIIFFEQHFKDFYLQQNDKVLEKIEYVLKVVRQAEKIPSKFFDHINGSDGIFEIRVKVGSDIFRIFCCFDGGNIVILFNGFQKKSQKTPKNEIIKAEKLKKQYFDSKSKKS